MMVFLALATPLPASAGTAAVGSMESAVITSQATAPWTVMYRSYDTFRDTVWAWAVLPGVNGYLHLAITPPPGFSTGSLRIRVTSYQNQNGNPLGLTFAGTDQAYTSSPYFNFDVQNGAVLGTYTVNFQIYTPGASETSQATFYVKFQVNNDADTFAPRALVQSQISTTQTMQSQAFPITISLYNIGSELAAARGLPVWGNGIQVYLENAEFVDAALNGFDSYAAFDYNDPTGRALGGAHILEVYTSSIARGGSPILTANVRATGAVSSNLLLEL